MTSILAAIAVARTVPGTAWFLICELGSVLLSLALAKALCVLDRLARFDAWLKKVS